MITIYKRGRIWWARGTVKGRLHRVSLDTQFQEVAWSRAMDIERRVDEGLDGRPQRWPRFQAEFLAWVRPQVAPSTFKKYSFILGRFGQSLKRQNHANLLDISPSTVVAYIAERMEDVHPKHGTKPASHGGLRSDLRILRRTFNYARDNKYVHDNPVKQLRLNHTSATTLPFTDEELSRMFADHEVRQKPRLRAMMLTLLYSGLRISDVAGLERSNIHFDTGRIERKTQKTGALVSLPLHSDLRVALMEHLADRGDSDSPLVFPTDNGKYDHSLQAKLRRVWKRAGIQSAHAHRFRDTYAVKLLARGASLYDVAKLLGNSIRIVERHYSPYTKELQERGARLVNELRLLPAPPAEPAGVIPIRAAKS